MSTEQIRNLLTKSIGLDPGSVGVPVIDRAIRKPMEESGVATVSAYYDLLRSSPDAMKNLVESVVVGESWFFRQPESFKYMTGKLKKNALQFTSRHRLHILSIGCSTGEEPYSLAMTLLQLGLPPDIFVIDALDISDHALAAARVGRYREKSFDKKTDRAVISKYFVQEDQHYVLNDNVRACVNFVQGNILDKPSLSTGANYNLVFCRHVLIYLCVDARKALMEYIAGMLAPGGTVFVGASETGVMRHSGFTAVPFAGAFAFELSDKETDPSDPVVISRKKAKEKPGGGASSKELKSTLAAPGKQARKKRKPVSRPRPLPTADLTPEPPPEQCWLRTGSSGDRSCEKLPEYVTCRRCPKCIMHGRTFLDRSPPDDYMDHWLSIISRPEEEQAIQKEEQAVIFRIEDSIFAFPSRMVTEITGPKDIHKIPHRSNDVFLGMANFSGELRLCLSLRELLCDRNAVSTGNEKDELQKRAYERMITIGKDGVTWAFPVDEIIGLHRLDAADVLPLSVPDARASTYSLGQITLDDRTVLCLDDQLLFDNLERSIR